MSDPIIHGIEHAERQARQAAERAAFLDWTPDDVLDAPDPDDVAAIADLNASIADSIDAFTGEEWPNLGGESGTILRDWFRVS